MARFFRGQLGKKESKILFCHLYNNRRSTLSQISSIMVCLTWWAYKLKLSIKLPTPPLVCHQFSQMKWSFFPQTFQNIYYTQNQAGRMLFWPPIISFFWVFPQLCHIHFLKYRGHVPKSSQYRSTNQTYFKCLHFPGTALGTRIQQWIRNHSCPVRVISLFFFIIAVIRKVIIHSKRSRNTQWVIR